MMVRFKTGGPHTIGVTFPRRISPPPRSDQHFTRYARDRPDVGFTFFPHVGTVRTDRSTPRREGFASRRISSAVASLVIGVRAGSTVSEVRPPAAAASASTC
jgi:hypothetical protein